MGKVTKTEIFLLVLTLLFAAAAAALFFTGRPRSEGYTVTTQRGRRRSPGAAVRPPEHQHGHRRPVGNIGRHRPVLAQRIVEYREANGPFASVDGLLEVKGLGPGILEAIRPQITAEEEP